MPALACCVAARKRAVAIDGKQEAKFQTHWSDLGEMYISAMIYDELVNGRNPGWLYLITTEGRKKTCA